MRSSFRHFFYYIMCTREIQHFFRAKVIVCPVWLCYNITNKGKGINKMRFTQFARICGGQDGAVWGDLLLRGGSKGVVRAYSLAALRALGVTEEPAPPLCEIALDKAELVMPHCNTVCFGPARYAPEDEFPLLYANVYNNYAAETDRRLGQTCVYRLQRTERGFVTTLVQLICIGFCDSRELWLSGEEDVRPYGNFLVDCDANRFYAYVMRDGADSTRYFAFELPAPDAGRPDEDLGARRVVLERGQVLSVFDCPYHRYVQGGCIHEGVLYSVEGFTNSPNKPAAMRLIDLAAGRQVRHIDLVAEGLNVEPELIDFSRQVCYYADNVGRLYTVEF